jgi:hypothetical protein
VRGVQLLKQVKAIQSYVRGGGPRTKAQRHGIPQAERAFKQPLLRPQEAAQQSMVSYGSRGY